MSDVVISDETARDGFVYAYGMDEAYKFLFETTIEPGVPLNSFQRMHQLADDTYTAHPSINNDTLHVQGWLDVGAEPVVVTVPDFDEGRYWILHTMDMGHYTTAMLGSRVRGRSGGRFLFASYTWAGDVPEGIDEVVRSHSDLIKVMGRVMTIGGDDLPAAQGYVDAWGLQPLSGYIGVTPPAPVERSFPGPEDTTWVERVNVLLGMGSMAQADAHWLPRYAALGLGVEGRALTEEQNEAAARGERLGLAHLIDLAPTMTTSQQLLGTREVLQETPRDLFAEGTYLGQWGLPPVESVYIKIDLDEAGDPINGSDGRTYRARFTAPDVSEFWSFTAYRIDNRLMAHNALNRHSRGDRTLTPDANGQYTIELGADTDANADNDNYLPIPEMDAYLILRMYGPSQAIQDGNYTPPAFHATE